MRPLWHGRLLLRLLPLRKNGDANVVLWAIRNHQLSATSIGDIIETCLYQVPDNVAQTLHWPLSFEALHTGAIGAGLKGGLQAIWVHGQPRLPHLILTLSPNHRCSPSETCRILSSYRDDNPNTCSKSN
jgi:hypothetical protein